MEFFKIIGIIGFILSATAALLGATFFLAIFGFIPWFISIIFRFLAWFLMSKKVVSKFYFLYFVTSILVLVLGLASILLSFFILVIYGSKASPTSFVIPVIVWSIYSLFEFICYLITKGIAFKVAMINIVGIILMYIGVLFEIGPVIRIAFIILSISAISAAIGFITLKEKIKEDIIYKPPPPL